MKKINLMFAILGILIILSVIVSAQEYNCPMGGYGGMMSGVYGYGGIFFGWIIGLLIIALIIAVIYWLIKSANKKNK